NIQKLTTHDLTQYIISQKPDIVGFGGTLTEWPQASQVAASIKEQSPDICTVYGGPNASANPEKHVKYFDFVFRGWAEQSFRNFIIDYSGRDDWETIGGLIDGLCYQDENGAQHIEPPALNINLDDVKYPARDIIDIGSYKRVQFRDVCQQPTDIVVASRGCPFKCTFCSSKSIWNQKYLTRSVEAVIDEIKMMQRLYGTKTCHFREDNLVVNKQYLESLCEGLKKLHDETGLQWICQARADALTRDVIRMMKSSGCVVVCCGWESANDSTLKFIDKGFSFRDVVNTIQLLEEEKLCYSGGFLVGTLNETEKEIKNTLEFTKKVSQLPHSFVPRGAGRYVSWPISESYREVIDKDMVEFNWQNGEQLISGTYTLSAAQVEECIARNW
ncbi:hypothetical protein LCGC14_2094700, partial [marine sediment metagenome]